jgi:hypothetical protein
MPPATHSSNSNNGEDDDEDGDDEWDFSQLYLKAKAAEKITGE